MSFIEFLYIAFYFLMAFGAAIAVVAVLGFSLHAELLWTEKLVPAIAPLIVLGVGLSSLLSGRNLAFAEKHIELLSGQLGGGTNVLRVINVTILCIAIAKLAGVLLQRHKTHSAPERPLMLALLAYVAANNGLPSVFGTEPAFMHSLFYAVVIFAAAWAARHEPMDAAMVWTKYALHALMAASLLAALIVPDIAVQPNYGGLIPFIKIRLWGLGSNANSIGPLALLALLLEYLYPAPRILLRILLLCATGCVFLLAQSKTAWIALVVAVAILAWYRWPDSRRERRTTVALLTVIGLGAALLATMLFADPAALWDDLVNTREGDNLTSLSGRTQIWEVALREWSSNPIFGYGPEVWGQTYRTQIGMPFAFSAHNQFLQTLSMAGALGLASLLVYLGYLIRAAHRMTAQTRGVSVALLAVMLLRCISEAPLAMTGILDGNVLIHLVLFQLASRAYEERVRARPSPGLRQPPGAAKGACSMETMTRRATRIQGTSCR